VFTVDFFTPVVDDPYHFGMIAAANSISDVYAMGGEPFLALNVMGFPINEVPGSVLSKILAGAADKAMEAGIVIGGGHSVKDPELKFGMCVLGFVDNKSIIDNSRAKPGDRIFLTKPIGTGIITTAQKRTNRVPKSIMNEIINSMERLNANARNKMVKSGIRAATDITGFGLLGHLHEVATASGVDIDLYSSRVPLFTGACDYAKKGFVPGGTFSNLEYLSKHVEFDGDVAEYIRFLLCDAQTSGGMAIFCPPEKADKLAASLKRDELRCEYIGDVASTGTGKINVK